MLRSCIPMPINLLKSQIALLAYDNDLASFTTNRKFKHRSIALNSKLGHFVNENICAASSKANCLSWNSTFRDSDVLPGKTVVSQAVIAIIHAQAYLIVIQFVKEVGKRRDKQDP